MAYISITQANKQKFKNPTETLRDQLIFICMEFTCKSKLECQVLTCWALKRFAIAIETRVDQPVRHGSIVSTRFERANY